MEQAKQVNVFDTPEFKRSRKSYIVYSLVEYLGSILITDAFLAKLLTTIGVSDSLTGIISTFISLGGVFQILSILVARSKASAKSLSIIAYVSCMTMYMMEYIVPFLPVSHGVKVALFIVFILLAYAFLNLTTNINFKWANSFVEPGKRGSFSATKEMISLIGGMVFSYAMGATFDRLGNVDINLAFIVMALSLLVINAIGFVSLLLIRKKPHYSDEEKPTVNHSFKEIIANTFGNRAYVYVVIMACLWSVSRYLIVGFMGTFKIKDLAISVGTVQIINIIANGLRFVFAKPLGRYSDKHSYAKGMKLGLLLELISYFAVLIASPKLWWVIAFQTIFYFIGLGGTNANSINIVYNYVKTDYFVEANAIKAALCGVLSFGIAILGGKIVDIVQANGNHFLGVHIYGQQVLAVISIIVMIINLLFIHFVLEKQKIKVR